MMKDKKGEWINEAQLTGNIYGRGEAANELYRLIWKPIQSYLAGVSYINYTTEGLLNDIAFNSIFVKKDFLMNRYKFRRFSSLLEVESEISIQKMPQNVNIWGNMDYKESVYLNENAMKYNDLDTSKRQTISYIPSNIKTPTQTKSISKKPLQPFNLVELTEIKKIFHDNKVNYTFYENANATEENFKMQAATTKGVLHISTHGFYTPANRNKEKDFLPGDYIAGVTNPLFRCGLAFSGANYYWMKGISKDNHDDGILTGYEISQLDLSNVNLVVLSACETALGDITDNEGNIGLQTAFEVAGVKHMIVSLWEVPVKQTSELFSLFYKNWLQGKSLSSALQEAQKTMQKKDYPPYYWAGFVLIE